MAGTITTTNTFASQTGPIPLSQLDANFTNVNTSINNLNIYSNYYADSSLSANTITVTTTGSQTVTYAAGLTLAIKVNNTNTGATTINVNSLGAKSLVTGTSTALNAGAITSGQIVVAVYDGTNFQLQGVFSGEGNFASIDVSGAANLNGTVTLGAGTANGVLYLNGSKAVTSGSALVFDGTNLGVGGAPNSWLSSLKAQQIGVSLSLWGTGSGSNNAGMESNSYINTSGNSTYINSNYATRYQQYSGQHQWYVAPSGTAGSTITFTQAMTLDNSGNLTVTGTGNPTLTVNSAAGAYTSILKLQAAGGGGSVINATGASSDLLAFQITGTERARIDSNGNLGLGVTPSGWASSYKAFQLQGGALASNSASGMLVSTNAYSNGSNWIYTNNGYASQYWQTSGQHQWFVAASGTATNAISFTQAMTLDASGNLLVGTTTVLNSSVATFYKTATSSNQRVATFVNNGTSGSTTAAGIIIYYPNASSGNGSTFIQCSDGNSDRFYVLGSGNVQNANNSYGAISDVKLKENIVDATPKLDDLMKVQVRHYNLKNDPNKAKQIGVVAQEVEQVFSGIVETNTDGTKGVKYSVFVPMLIKAIQELNTLVTAQAAEIAALKAKVGA